MTIASSINIIYLKVNSHVLERKVVWDVITHGGNMSTLRYINLQVMVLYAFGRNNTDSAGVAL